MQTINLNPTQPQRSMAVLADEARRANRELGILDNHLLTLRLNLGKLRAGAEQALAPLVATAAPFVNSVLRQLTDFCHDAGAVMAALFGTVYKKTVTTAQKTTSALRRSLASFDELQRLNGGSGGASQGPTVTLEPVNDPLTPQLEAIVLAIQSAVGRIQAFLAPLGAIRFDSLGEAFRGLGAAIVTFASLVGSHLGTAWHTLLVPLAAWVIQEAAPLSVGVLQSAVELLTAALHPLLAGIASLLPVLSPAAEFMRQTFALVLTQIREKFQGLTAVFQEKAPVIRQIFQNIGQVLSALWTAAQPVLEGLRNLFCNILDAMGDRAALWSAGLIDAFYGLTEFLAGVFTGDWTRAWEGLKSVLKGAVNGVIGLINRLLSGMAGGLNAVTAALNKWHVEVPNWVPVVGGKTFGFNLKPITAPQIPYLAKGAVLPANKPFLAMVGDQRHGTNVEAPLATIQEAVRLSLDDLVSGNMAGHEATVAVLEQLLTAVQSIRIGDDAIAAACERSRTRHAVLYGNPI